MVTSTGSLLKPSIVSPTEIRALVHNCSGHLWVVVSLIRTSSNTGYMSGAGDRISPRLWPDCTPPGPGPSLLQLSTIAQTSFSSLT